MKARSKVYIVDDDLIIRRSVGLSLQNAGFDTRPFASGDDFIEASVYLPPGCVLLDVNMPGISGLDVQQYLIERRPDLPIIIMTGEGDIPMAVKAIKAGAIDFIEKPFADPLLVQMLRNGFERLDGILERRRREGEAAEKIARLTSREHDVLAGLLSGLSNKLVAYRLGLSVRTAEMHRANLMHKLGVRSLPEVVHLAHIAGMPIGEEGHLGNPA